MVLQPELSALSPTVPNAPDEASYVWFLSNVYTLRCILVFAATSAAFIHGVAVVQGESCQAVLDSFQLNDWSPSTKDSALKVAAELADVKLISFQRTALVTVLVGSISLPLYVTSLTPGGLVSILI